MKRSDFLKRLGLGIAAIPFAKQVAGAVTEVVRMDDEEGVFPRYVDPQPPEVLEQMRYGHYEEPFVHPAGWPLRVNDLILVPDNSGEIEGELQYMVTSIHRDPIEGHEIATCLPLVDGPEILLTKENSNSVIVFSNIKSQL